MLAMTCLVLAGLCGAFYLGRSSNAPATERSGPHNWPVVNANDASSNLDAAAQMPMGTVPVDRACRVREQLRQLNLSGDNLLPSVCRLARWLEQADEEDLSVALVDGESVVGKKVAETMVPLIFLRWGEIDRVGAMDAMTVYYQSQEGRGEDVINALEPFFNKWAEEDPRAAIDALLGLELPQGTYRPSYAVFSTINERDPHLAATMCLELAKSTDPTRRDFGEMEYHNIMMRLVETDGLERTLIWAQQQPDLSLGTQLLTELTKALLDRKQDKEAVQAFAALRDSTAPSDPDFVKDLSAAMARVDPVRARSWVLTLPSGAARGTGVLAMAQQISEKQSVPQALAWLQGCGSQTDFDGAYEELAKGWPASDPAGKYRCAQGITDPVLRSWLKYQAGFELMQADEPTAVQVLPIGMSVKIKQMQDMMVSYQEEVIALFPGTKASFTVTPQPGIPADEP